MPEQHEHGTASGRAFWSGTITFGLVSVPVDLFAAVHARETSMKMVDARGRPLGRRYFCPRDGQALEQDDLVRGFETESGKMVVVTDEELENVAPEKSRDIDLRQFVPLDQIPRALFDRPYFLLPAGRSTKAYHLLAAVMERAGRAGIATFVMREKEYLVAIVADRGVLRAETLRFASELRTPDQVGLPAPAKPAGAAVKKFGKAIGALERDGLDPREVADWYAEEIRALVERKHKAGKDVVEMPPDAEDEEGELPGADVIDLMKILRQRLAGNASVSTALDDAGASGKPERRSAPRRRAGRSEDLAALPKDELEARAKRLGIAGRSRMSKAELRAAIRKAA